MKNIASEKLRTAHGLLSSLVISALSSTSVLIPKRKKKTFSAKTFKSLDGIFNIILGQKREIIYFFVGEPSGQSCTKEVYDVLEPDAEW